MAAALRVLIIDDHHDSHSADFISKALRGVPNRYNVIVVNSILKGVDAARDTDVVILVTSLCDNYHFDAITTITNWHNVPTVVSADPDYTITGLPAIKAGAQDYMVNYELDEHTVRRAVLFGVERYKREMQKAELDVVLGALAGVRKGMSRLNRGVRAARDAAVSLNNINLVSR